MVRLSSRRIELIHHYILADFFFYSLFTKHNTSTERFPLCQTEYLYYQGLDFFTGPYAKLRAAFGIFKGSGQNVCPRLQPKKKTALDEELEEHLDEWENRCLSSRNVTARMMCVSQPIIHVILSNKRILLLFWIVKFPFFFVLRNNDNRRVSVDFIAILNCEISFVFPLRH